MLRISDIFIIFNLMNLFETKFSGRVNFGETKFCRRDMRGERGSPSSPGHGDGLNILVNLNSGY